MQRDLQAMAGKTYDLVVVGGGITGACVARDAALRGLTVALFEKDDFAGATTAASSKLIHGGLRYLANLELRLVRESLRERRVWSKVAPHMIDPLPFLMMTPKQRRKSRMAKSIALTLYDWLAYDRNRLDDPEKTIPGHTKLSREEIIELEPDLASGDLQDSFVFTDYQMHSPERLALDCVLGAAEHGADVANYAEITEFLVEDGAAKGVRVRDKRPEAEAETEDIEVFARVVVNAAGPWADLLMAKMNPAVQDAPARQLIRSKGIHLLTRALTRKHAVAYVDADSHFFILPWRGHSILGTTDTIYRGAPDDVHVTEKDIVDFLTVVNHAYPGANLLRSDVLHFYAGLRPIVDRSSPEADAVDGEEGAYAASRAAEVYDHDREDGLHAAITVIGGKWTTSRNLAEQVVSMAAAKLDRAAGPCVTAETPTYGGGVGRFADFSKQAVAKYPAVPSVVVEHLAKNYGSRVDDVLALTKENAEWGNRLSDRFPDIAAEVVYAVRNEMARSLGDVLFRRTGLGTLGSPGDGAIARVSEIMAAELGWDAGRREGEVAQTAAKFTSWARTLAVVNPHSWGDRTGAIWPDIEAKLQRAIGPVRAAFTDGPMDAQRLTTQALKAGMEQVIAVGGDGTINEVINGFFENGEAINPEAVVAFLTSGTGRDFRRTFDIPEDVDDQIERLAASRVRPVDVGRITFIDHDGIEQTRYFDNIASLGLSGATAHEVNRLGYGKNFGGKFAFQWGMFKALLRYRPQRVRLRVDEVFDEVLDVTTAAICNGQYFGGSMHMAPQAQPDDGLFDVVIVLGLGKIELLRKTPMIYRGEHLDDDRVTALRGHRIVAEPADPGDEVLLEVDGEAPGRLPATFEIVPNGIFLRC